MPVSVSPFTITLPTTCMNRTMPFSPIQNRVSLVQTLSVSESSSSPLYSLALSPVMLSQSCTPSFFAFAFSSSTGTRCTMMIYGCRCTRALCGLPKIMLVFMMLSATISPCTPSMPVLTSASNQKYRAASPSTNASRRISRCFALIFCRSTTRSMDCSIIFAARSASSSGKNGSISWPTSSETICATL